MTLVEFLLARIAEDKQIAQAATPGPWVRWDAPDVTAVAATETSLFGTPVTPSVWVVSGLSGLLPSDATHIARHDPVRVLAECDVKKQIIGLHRSNQGSNYSQRRGEWEITSAVLRLYALLYVNHPDYQEEWKL